MIRDAPIDGDGTAPCNTWYEQLLEWEGRRVLREILFYGALRPATHLTQIPHFITPLVNITKRKRTNGGEDREPRNDNVINV
jgi:hypothetical protein